MRRNVLVLLIAAAGVIIFLLVLPLFVNANQFRPAIESELTKSLGRQVKIGSLKLSILSGTVTAGDVSIADDPSVSSAPFLETKALKFSIGIWDALFSHKLNVTGVVVDAPEANLVQTPAGTWNFSSLGSKTAGQPSSANANLTLSMKSLIVENATLSLTRGHGKPEVLEDVNLKLKNFAPGSVFPLSMTAKIAGGGDVAVDGKAGPLSPYDIANTPLNATLKITNLNLAGSGAVPAASGIDGVVSLHGTLTSNGQTLQMNGEANVEKVKLARGAAPAGNPLTFGFALADDLRTHTGRISRGDLAIGSVRASLTGVWTPRGDAPNLMMVLSVARAPVSGLERLLPALGVGLPAGSTIEGGTATAKLAISGPVAAMIINGPVSIENTRLKGFDLGSKLAAVERLAGIRSGPDTDIQMLSADLRVDPAGTTLRNIRLVLPSIGTVTGDGTITPAHAIHFRMQAAVRAGLLSALSPPTIPFSIVGTSSDPQFRPDVGQLAASEINQELKGLKVDGVPAGQVAGGLLSGLLGGRKR